MSTDHGSPRYAGGNLSPGCFWMIMLVGLASVAVFGAYYWSASRGQGGQFAAIVPIATTCVVGYSGANMSITVTGIGSEKACDALVERDSRAYLRTTQPTEGVLCEAERNGMRLVVRDAGLLTLMGRGVCDELGQRR